MLSWQNCHHTVGAKAVLIGGEQVSIAFEQLEWASPRSEEDKEKPAFTTPGEILSTLDMIYVEADANGVYSLAQMPEVEGAKAAKLWHWSAGLIFIAASSTE